MSFSGQSVIITGASSGLGRAAALEFAHRGAHVGLIARNREALEEVAREIGRSGGSAMVLPADVTDLGRLQEAAAEFADRFGGIDVWVNNAGISVYGESDQVPIREQRRVMDVNFFGQLHGARVALPYLENSRANPVIVGVLSVLAEAATPLQSVYTASKHALAGFYKSLQEELIHRRSRVRISMLFAPSLSTPFFDHARTYMGYRPKPVFPVYPVEWYAKVLVDATARREFRVVRSGMSRFALWAFREALPVAAWFEGRTGYRSQRSRVPKSAGEGDSLFAPMQGTYGVVGSNRATPGWLRIEKFLAIGGIGLIGAGILSVLGPRFGKATQFDERKAA